MKAEEQTILNETLVKVLKLTPEQTSKLYNQDGDLTDLSCVIAADEARIAQFNTEKSAQYNRGIKEGATKIEKEVKEKYSVESDLIGSELIDSILVKQVTEATKEGTKDISKHPEYVKLQSGIDKQLKDKDKEWEDKVALRESEFNREQIFARVSKKALLNLEGRKPLLPTDPVKAQVWRDTYLKELRGAKYQEDNDGNPIVLDDNGEIKKNAHGHTVTFDEYEKSVSDKYFEYPVATPRSTPGNTPPPVGGVGDPKTKDECLAKLKEESISASDRKKYTDLMDTL